MGPPRRPVGGPEPGAALSSSRFSRPPVRIASPTMRLLLLVPLVLALPARGADLPPPPAPADYTLVKWAEVVNHFRKVDDASNRVLVRELGTTTEGRPYLAAFVSSPETIRDLHR